MLTTTNASSNTSDRLTRAILPLFSSMPHPKGGNPELLVAAYGVALEGLPLEAVESVVLKLVKGIWDEPVRFLPWPPELSSMVRKEASRHRAINDGRKSSTPVNRPPMIERIKAKFARHKVLGREVSFTDARSGRWPVGAVYVPALEIMFAPDNQPVRAPEEGLDRANEATRGFRQ